MENVTQNMAELKEIDSKMAEGWAKIKDILSEAKNKEKYQSINKRKQIASHDETTKKIPRLAASPGLLEQTRKIPINIHGLRTTAVIDPRSPTSKISRQTYEQGKDMFFLDQLPVIPLRYSEQRTYGSGMASIAYDTSTTGHTLRVHLVDGRYPVVLGLNFIQKYSQQVSAGGIITKPHKEK